MSRLLTEVLAVLAVLVPQHVLCRCLIARDAHDLQSRIRGVLPDCGQVFDAFFVLGGYGLLLLWHDGSSAHAVLRCVHNDDLTLDRWRSRQPIMIGFYWCCDHDFALALLQPLPNSRCATSMALERRY